MSRRLLRLAVLAAAVAAVPRASAQQPASRASADSAARFTVDDALDLVSFTVADLSADGRWLAATSSSRRDGLGGDFSRDGDPTYIRPQKVRVWVIDT